MTTLNLPRLRELRRICMVIREIRPASVVDNGRAPFTERLSVIEMEAMLDIVDAAQNYVAVRDEGRDDQCILDLLRDAIDAARNEKP